MQPEEKRMNTVQYIGSRPIRDEERGTFELAHDVEVWGRGVRVALSDGETVHEFPNWSINRDGRASGGTYSYALSGTGELHIVETYHYAPGSMDHELRQGKPKRSIVLTYSGHGWSNVTGDLVDAGDLVPSPVDVQ